MLVLAYLGPLDCGIQRAADIVELSGELGELDGPVLELEFSQAKRLLAALDGCRAQLHGAERPPVPI